ncbi:MAG: hypothetical protein HFJ17_02660 [Clostridia bacterium]|nr:hypothetical protein [Clostridia bacterium]
MNKKFIQKSFLTIILSLFAVLLYNTSVNAANMNLTVSGVQDGTATLSGYYIYYDADGYEIYDGDRLHTTTSATSCTLYGLSTSNVHTLKVRAYANYYGQMVYSDFAYINVFPNAISDVKTSLVGKTDIKVTWNKKEGVTGYKVYRSTSQFSGYTQVANIASKDTNFYTDPKLASGKTYYYKVVPYLNNGVQEYNGGDSNITNITTFNDSKISGINLKTEAGSTLAYVYWNKSYNPLDGYEIYRSTSKKGKYKKVKSVSKNKSSYTDKKLKKSKTYYYKIRGYKKINGKTYYTKYSNVKSIKTSYVTKNVKLPLKTSSYSGDKVTIKSLSTKYKKNSGSKALYEIKMKLQIKSKSSSGAYFTINFYDKNGNYIGYTNLKFDKKRKNYTKTFTWKNVKIPKKAVSFSIR